MTTTDFVPWPSFMPEEADAAARVIASNRVNYWTGDEGRAFEREFATWCGTDHAIALANGTVALDLALKAFSIGPGDEVIVTPRSFIASVSCVVNAGATPVFADVDRETQTITAESCRAVLSSRTKAIIPVHLAGHPCDMDPIMDLAAKHNLLVIEDCAQAHGARYKGRSVGSIGHVGAWSFCQDKIMTTGGEGGMVTTNDREAWLRMWSFKDHGKSYDAVYNRAHPPGFRWIHESFGTNWRMLEVQSAIGRIQLRHMAAWTAARRANAERIWSAAKNLKGLRVPQVPNWAELAAYKCYVFVKPDQLAEGWSRARIIQEITAQGVPCFEGSCPEIYLERAFEGSGFRPKDRLPGARELGETSLMFLVHPTLSPEAIQTTCDVLTTVMGHAQSA
jgi:dTDP-4-amino-4,6-dideoxygalactose transaminase